MTTRQSHSAKRSDSGGADREIAREVAAVLAELRPALQSDGGDIELVDVGADGVVRVRLLGACIGCPSSTDTLKLGVEDTLRDRLPQIKKVVCV